MNSAMYIEYWNIEILKYWNIEILKYWNIEILKYWNIEIMKYWNIEIMKYLILQFKFFVLSPCGLREALIFKDSHGFFMLIRSKLTMLS